MCWIPIKSRVMKFGGWDLASLLECWIIWRGNLLEWIAKWRYGESYLATLLEMLLVESCAQCVSRAPGSGPDGPNHLHLLRSPGSGGRGSGGEEVHMSVLGGDSWALRRSGSATSGNSCSPPRLHRCPRRLIRLKWRPNGWQVRLHPQLILC
jgi:hypothetical protein